MPIPLGILAAAGAGAAGGGSAYDLLESTVLTTSASSVTFSNLGNYSDYKHLQLRAVMKTGGTNYVVYSQVNGNTTLSSYTAHRMYVSGGQVYSQNETAQGNLGTLLADYTTANSFAGLIMDILDFSSTNKFKTIRAINGARTNDSYLQLSSGLLKSTAAVTSLRLFPETNSFISGSRFSLYGIKG